MQKKLLVLAISIGLTHIPIRSMDRVADLNLFFYINTGILTAQALALVALKKSNYLFKDRVLPDIIELSNNSYFPVRIRPKHGLCGLACVPALMLVPLSMISHFSCPAVNELLNGGLGASVAAATGALGIVHFTNLSYQDCLKSLKEGVRKLPLTIKSKVAIDSDFLLTQECAICHEIPDTDCVNPCNVAEHIYCRSCLMHWLDKKHELRDNQEVEEKFICELCTQPVDSTKIEIMRIGKKAVGAKDVLWDLVGINGFYIVFIAAEIYKIMQCSLFAC